MLYSGSTCGFYERAVHGSAIPADAIGITHIEYAALLAGQASGKHITTDKGGNPVLIDQPAPSSDELAAQARNKRDALITETDYLVMPDYPATSAKLAAIKTYRQALRDVPAQSSFPVTINWPAKP